MRRLPLLLLLPLTLAVAGCGGLVAVAKELGPTERRNFAPGPTRLRLHLDVGEVHTDAGPVRCTPDRHPASAARAPRQGPSRTSSMAASLCSVSAHSSSGSEPGTMPAPASRRARRPSRAAQRRATAHSPSPAASTQPTGPA